MALDRFRSELEAVGGRVSDCASMDEAASRVLSLMPRERGSIAVSDNPRLAPVRRVLESAGFDILPSLAEFTRSRADPREDQRSVHETYKKRLMTTMAGVTFANHGVADTGTLALLSGHEQHRLISLVPPLHVCLLSRESVLEDLSSLLELVYEGSYSEASPPRAMTLITGPSRTADIELTLTLGVHGPREVHVLLCD